MGNNGHTDQLELAAKRALAEDRARHETAAHFMATIPGQLCTQVVTGEVTDPQGNKAIKQLFMLPTGPFALVYDLDFVENVAKNILQVVAKARSGLEVIGNLDLPDPDTAGGPLAESGI